MDLSMPVMDGFEATRQLKRMDATKHIPVIAVSAFCDDPAKHRLALSVGCADCVEKPIQLDKVKAAIQAV
jgi:CheY-like chemotaxis protein